MIFIIKIVTITVPAQNTCLKLIRVEKEKDKSKDKTAKEKENDKDKKIEHKVNKEK